MTKRILVNQKTIMMKKKIHDLKVIKNQRVNHNNFILELKAPEPLSDIFPGQFAQVLVEKSESTFLRRPFSIHDVNYKNNSLQLLIQILGKGTQLLSESKAGENINTVYPLGNSFNINDCDKPLLIGGGTGIAPMYFLAKTLQEKGIRPMVLMGGRDKESLLKIEEFTQISDVYYTTEDGSSGEKGLVTDHSVLNTPENFSKIYTCGPEPMMRAVGKYALKNNIPCEVSLENLMACGFGACLCCVVETKSGNICTCTEGPVFNINDLKW
jgi:dihydroorotate dehydrogenase electron transfer subunit